MSYSQFALIFLRNIKKLVLMEFLPYEEVSKWLSEKFGLKICDGDEEDEECEDEEIEES